MRYIFKISIGILITIFSMIQFACDSDEASPELPNIEYKLVITDSIGVEIGDTNYILAWPVNLTHSSDGSIAYVDRIKHAVFMYTPDGEFIRTIGREGEGPGEFRMPSDISFYSDGSFLIRDMYGISLFDSSYEYQEPLVSQR